jgi:hypothetical protein
VLKFAQRKEREKKTLKQTKKNNEIMQMNEQKESEGGKGKIIFIIVVIITHGFLSNLIFINFGSFSRQSFGKCWSLFESNRLWKKKEREREEAK